MVTHQLFMVCWHGWWLFCSLCSVMFCVRTKKRIIIGVSHPHTSCLLRSCLHNNDITMIRCFSVLFSYPIYKTAMSLRSALVILFMAIHPKQQKVNCHEIAFTVEKPCLIPLQTAGWVKWDITFVNMGTTCGAIIHSVQRPCIIQWQMNYSTRTSRLL